MSKVTWLWLVQMQKELALMWWCDVHQNNCDTQWLIVHCPSWTATTLYSCLSTRSAWVWWGTWSTRTWTSPTWMRYSMCHRLSIIVPEISVTGMKRSPLYQVCHLPSWYATYLLNMPSTFLICHLPSWYVTYRLGMLLTIIMHKPWDFIVGSVTISIFRLVPIQCWHVKPSVLCDQDNLELHKLRGILQPWCPKVCQHAHVCHQPCSHLHYY